MNYLNAVANFQKSSFYLLLNKILMRVLFHKEMSKFSYFKMQKNVKIKWLNKLAVEFKVQRVYLVESLLLNWSFRLRGPIHCCHMAEGRFENARERQVILVTQSWVLSHIMINISSKQLHWSNWKKNMHTMAPSTVDVRKPNVRISDVRLVILEPNIRFH